MELQWPLVGASSRERNLVAQKNNPSISNTVKGPEK